MSALAELVREELGVPVDPRVAAMAQAMLLPAAVIALGVVLVLFLRRPAHLAQR